MKTHKNNKWLDDALKKAIGSERKDVDFESFKQRHTQAVEKLTSRAGRYTAVRSPNIWRTIVKSRFTKFAAAAVIIIAVSLIGFQSSTDKKSKSAENAKAVVSPAELTTFASLSFAYRRGGMEMVEKMCDKASIMAGPRPVKISVYEFDGGPNDENRKGKNL